MKSPCSSRSILLLIMLSCAVCDAASQRPQIPIEGKIVSRAELTNAPASRLSIAKAATLATNVFRGGAVVFSPDVREVAYVTVGLGRDLLDPRTLVIVNTETLDQIASITITNLAETMAWSPDKKRIILIASSSTSSISVVDLEAKREIKLPLVLPAIPKRVSWHSESKVYYTVYNSFSNSEYPAGVLDLDTLKITAFEDNTPPEQLKMGNEAFEFGHPRCDFSWESPGGGYAAVGTVYVINKDKTYSRGLVKHENLDARCYPSPDLSKLIVERSRRIDAQSIERADLEILYVGLRDEPNFQFEADFKLTEDSRTKLEAMMNEGSLIRCAVFSALTNPLNGKIVGPNLEDFKGYLRLQGWDESRIALDLLQENAPIVNGSVISGFEYPGQEDKVFPADMWKQIRKRSFSPKQPGGKQKK